MRVLDAYCCQGGASAGYVRAGFTVVGVDIVSQPRYPYRFMQGDAIEYISRYGSEFDFIHTSPPCQFYTKCQRIQGNSHPDLIRQTRDALNATGRPWVIENVEDAWSELRSPIMLCGAMFGLRTYRHRLFEFGGGMMVGSPKHQWHSRTTVKMGRELKPGDYYHAVGNFSNVDYVRQDMGHEWMSREGLRECIPKAYTAYIGDVVYAALATRRSS